jgi:hypothetical protein
MDLLFIVTISLLFLILTSVECWGGGAPGIDAEIAPSLKPGAYSTVLTYIATAEY